MRCIVEHMVESIRETSTYMIDGSAKNLYASLRSIPITAMAILQLTRVKKWSFPVSEDKIHDAPERL